MVDIDNVILGDTGEAEAEPVVRIHATLVPKVNLAFHQNSLPSHVYP